VDAVLEWEFLGSAAANNGKLMFTFLLTIAAVLGFIWLPNLSVTMK